MEFLQAFDELFQLYYLDNNKLVRWKTLTSSNLLNFKIEYNYIETDLLTLETANFDVFNEIYQMAQTNTIIIERLYNTRDEINESGGTLADSIYNNIFYVNKLTLTDSVNTDDNARTIVAYDWKGFVEDRKLISHNVFYTADTLPVDEETGEVSYPDDFNKIKYSNNFVDQIKEIYNNNIIDPYHLVKGVEPYREANNRKVKGYNDTELIVNGTLTSYNTLQEKKSILEYKTKFYNTSFDNENYNVLRVDNTIYNSGGNYYNSIVYNPQNTHIIDYLLSLDKINDFTIDIDGTEMYNFAYVESDSDDFDYKSSYDVKDRELTSFETFGTSSNDDGDTSSIQSSADELLNSSRELVTRTAEIYFNEKIFMKDIKVGDFVEFYNFDTLLNGRYIIKKITEIFEGKLRTYSIDEMEYLQPIEREE